MYLPKNRGNQQLAAIVVGGPFGAVKEQASGLYAQTMAERGFVTLAFDGSYTGESGGEPRNIASPDINTEDFMAAVDFIGLQPYVDRERIGMIGICGWGGMALNAVATDKRVKAVVANTMYDMTRVMSKGYNDSVTPEQRAQALEQMSRQRWDDAVNGKPAYQPAYNQLKGGEAQQRSTSLFCLDSPYRFHTGAYQPRGYWCLCRGRRHGRNESLHARLSTLHVLWVPTGCRRQARCATLGHVLFALKAARDAVNTRPGTPGPLDPSPVAWRIRGGGSFRTASLASKKSDAGAGRSVADQA